MSSGGTIQDPGGNDHSGRDYRPGEQIAARYEVLELLGRGASGVVYRVHDRATDEEVAVKIIAEPIAGIEQLRSEVRLAWRVTHPNVLRVFDIVEHREGALLSMQYAEAGTLADRVGERLTDDETRAIAAPILDALEAAHQAGVVHRDLKPANVLIDKSGRLLLADFGVAKRLGAVASTGEGGISGTPAYMAPEQLTGDEVDARADLYSLGIIIYQLLAGTLPFVPVGSEVTLPMALKRVADEIPPLEDSALAGAVKALTRRDPDKRPASVAAARPLLGIDDAHQRRRGWPWIAVPIAAAALATGIWALRAGGDPAPPSPPAATVEPAVRSLTAGDEIVAQAPTFTPDGSVVFSSNRMGQFQLWTIDPDQATARPLTSGPRAKTAPQFSAGWLYFQIARPAGGYDLVRLPEASLQVTQPGRAAELVREDVRSARVSPAGDLLSVRRVQGVGHQARIEIHGSTTYFVGPESEQVTFADWSPDGRRIAYGRRDQLKEELGSIWLLDPPNGQPRRIVDGLPAWGQFVWADHESIAFFRGDGDRRALFLVNVESGREVRLAARFGYASLPAISADGRMVYVTDKVEFGVWVYDSDQRLRRVTSLGAGHAKSPSWVTTDNQLVYLVELPGEGFEVRRVRADDFSKITARRAISGDNPYIATSPDGRYACFGTRRGDESLLLLADLDSDSEPTILARAKLPADLYPNEISVNGTRVTYIIDDTSGRSEIHDVGLDGANPRLLVADAGAGLRSSDGSWIAYNHKSKRAEGGIRIQRMGGDGKPGGDRKLVPGTIDVEMYRFGPGADEITAMDLEELYVVNFATGKRRRLAFLPRGTLYPDRMSVHPDGRVAMMLGVGDRSLVVIENYAALAAAATR